jgi:hypothetical protein
MSKTIAKGRFRSDLPGRTTDAIATALRNSMNGLTRDTNGMMEGMKKHQQRVEAMDPAEIERRALAQGYMDLEVKGKEKKPRKTKAAVITMATIAPVGEVVMATEVKPKRKYVRKETRNVPRKEPKATVIPAGDISEFIDTYLKHKGHGKKGKTMMSYLREQYEKGNRYNPDTKRFVKNK